MTGSSVSGANWSKWKGDDEICLDDRLLPLREISRLGRAGDRDPPFVGVGERAIRLFGAPSVPKTGQDINMVC